MTTADEHANCEAPWFCLCCEKPICPRCDPSPVEEELCRDCWWIADPGTPGLGGVA